MKRLRLFLISSLSILLFTFQPAGAFTIKVDLTSIGGGSGQVNVSATSSNFFPFTGWSESCLGRSLCLLQNLASNVKKTIIAGFGEPVCEEFLYSGFGECLPVEGYKYSYPTKPLGPPGCVGGNPLPIKQPCSVGCEAYLGGGRSAAQTYAGEVVAEERGIIGAIIDGLKYIGNLIIGGETLPEIPDVIPPSRPSPEPLPGPELGPVSAPVVIVNPEPLREAIYVDRSGLIPGTTDDFFFYYTPQGEEQPALVIVDSKINYEPLISGAIDYYKLGAEFPPIVPEPDELEPLIVAVPKYKEPEPEFKVWIDPGHVWPEDEPFVINAPREKEFAPIDFPLPPFLPCR